MRSTKSRILAAGLLSAALAGCAGFWDEVTSRDFDMMASISPPEPMAVLRTSTDGDARAKAYRRLEEPRRGGGSDALQDEVVKTLSDAAIGETQPLCRMAAINSLGRFQDPRAVTALVSAYESAEQLTPDVAYMVRCQALAALGETRNPSAAGFIADVARQPTKTELADRERGQARDVRLAAVRALKNFPNTPAATDAVTQLAQSDRDVAVRDRAKETLVALTGKEPAAAPAMISTPTTSPGQSVQTVGHSQP